MEAKVCGREFGKRVWERECVSECVGERVRVGGRESVCGRDRVEESVLGRERMSVSESVWERECV